MAAMDRCENCKLLKDGFCLGDSRQNFYDDMWTRHEKKLPSKFAENMKSHLQRKAQNRKNADGSDYPPRCYYAVLLYQVILDDGNDHYTKDPEDTIDWTLAGNGGKKHSAPAIDHINPKCKNPFDDNGEPNLAFCRNDVNDAKNDLTIKEFVDLCEAVYKNSLSGPSGL